MRPGSPPTQMSSSCQKRCMGPYSTRKGDGMATDRNGQELAVNDTVNVPGYLKAIETNLGTGQTIVTVELMPISLSGDPEPVQITIDPVQVVKT